MVRGSNGEYPCSQHLNAHEDVTYSTLNLIAVIGGAQAHTSYNFGLYNTEPSFRNVESSLLSAWKKNDTKYWDRFMEESNEITAQ